MCCMYRFKYGCSSVTIHIITCTVHSELICIPSSFASWSLLTTYVVTERLKLKIPWKNLYSAPIIAEIDGLYAIAGPASGKPIVFRQLAQKRDPHGHNFTLCTCSIICYDFLCLVLCSIQIRCRERR